MRKTHWCLLVLALSAVNTTTYAGQILFKQSNCQGGSGIYAPAACASVIGEVTYGAALSAWSAPSTGKFTSASFGYFGASGVGISGVGESHTSPQHAMDNNQGTEAVLINFGSLNVALNYISIGWRSGDSDVSILRYTGSQAPSLGNHTVANLKNAQGWEWVGDYSSLSPTSALNFNQSGPIKTASWWLVSAYNSSYSGLAPLPGLTDANDYFKFSGFGGNVVAPTSAITVPEPGALALLCISLFGLFAARRPNRA